MITVHHLNNSRSQRVLWLLEELGCEYRVVRYERDPDTLLAPPQLRHVHPLGKSPVVTDGSHTLAESGATGADVQMSFPLEAAAARAGVALGPRVRQFLERIHARPAYRRAIAAGGEFRLAR